MLNRVISVNRNEQENRKTKVFLAQKPKIGYENSQNRQTESLNAPTLIEERNVPRSLSPSSMAALHNTPRHSGERTTWSFGAKKTTTTKQ